MTYLKFSKRVAIFQIRSSRIRSLFLRMSLRQKRFALCLGKPLHTFARHALDAPSALGNIMPQRLRSAEADSVSQVVLPINRDPYWLERLATGISALLSKAMLLAACGFLAVEPGRFNTT
ncbi:hypothetical protein HJB86_15765 [Rhizobium sp. NZLR3b]|uniref:hypothetical protein n=1 Tax=Rhizobium sp. NZLR3b TaxID=2731101 RepID=UPI001C837EC1|nr:hypothetical protein [Rhizobium sp. NZLR3b]MBX5190360.1 hypothetical protein [Rhizobium sp. NZLR3b]